MRQIEVLVSKGCPNVEATLAQVRTAIAATNATSDVKVVDVENDEAAVRLRFLGSPTVRIDGIDVDASARGRHDYGLQCRVYSVDGRLVGAPPAKWIESSLRGEALHPATASPDDG